MKANIPRPALLIYMLMLASPAFSASLPDYYPERFDRIGTLDDIDLDRRVMIINDVTIPIAIDLRVHNLNTRFSTARSLVPGMNVGFGTTGSRGLSGAVSDLWVLPADYVPPPPDDDNSRHERRNGRD